MWIKQALGAAAIALTLIAYFPYIRSIRRGQTRPHVFSWIIWGSTTLIVFLAQLSDGGGAGAWPIGVSGAITIYVALLAWTRKGDSRITRSDWVFFTVAMTSLPVWYLTADAFWAVVILTLTDLSGFGPTMTKAWRRPFEEYLPFFVIMTLRNFVAIAALERYSPTTVLFPALLSVAGAAFIAMVMVRRRDAVKCETVG